MTEGAQAGEAEGPRSQRMVKKVTYHSCGNIRSVWWTNIGFEGDGLIRGSVFGRLLSRAWSFAAVEKGMVWDVRSVCRTKVLAKRNAELSDDMIGIRKTIVRDVRAGKGLIVIQ